MSGNGLRLVTVALTGLFSYIFSTRAICNRNVNAGCASVNTPRNTVEKDDLYLLYANFIESKRRIRILKHGKETEVLGIIRNVVGNDLTLASAVRTSCLNKPKSFAFQSQVSAALTVLKDTC